MNPLPVLMYHSIGPVPDGCKRRGLFVPAASFDRQMALLRRRGIRGVTMTEAMDHLRRGNPDRACALTFDDGFLDNVETALPILEKHGHRATCYIVSGLIGKQNVWSRKQLQTLSPLMEADHIRQWIGRGMEIGAHTRTHARLTAIDDTELADEVGGSKAALEDRFGVPVTQFCYPWGDHDDRAVEAVRQAGFVGATTIVRGRARSPLDPLRIPRLHVHRHHWLFQFWLKLETRYGDRE